MSYCTQLFSIEEFTFSETFQFAASVRVHSEHPIFTGHFPGSPILPGVTYIDCVKMLAEKAFGVTHCLKKAQSMKFLSLINPVNNAEIKAEGTFIKNNAVIAVKAVFFQLTQSNEKIITAKINAELIQ